MLSEKEINLISKVCHLSLLLLLIKQQSQMQCLTLGRKLKIIFLDVALTTILKTVRRLCRNRTGPPTDKVTVYIRKNKSLVLFFCKQTKVQQW